MERANMSTSDAPEVDAEQRGVAELRHAFDVEDLLDLSAALDDGIHRLGVDVHLWSRCSRKNALPDKTPPLVTPKKVHLHF